MYKHFHVHQQVRLSRWQFISYKDHFFCTRPLVYKMVFVRLLCLCTKWSPVHEMGFVQNECHSLSTVDQWSLCVFDNPVLYTSVFLCKKVSDHVCAFEKKNFDKPNRQSIFAILRIAIMIIGLLSPLGKAWMSQPFFLNPVFNWLHPYSDAHPNILTFLK